MARCGSGALCTCALEDGRGTTVTGTGQAGVDPYRVHFVGNDEQACQAVTECVGENLDQGLRYNSQQHLLGTHLSSDDGQQLRYGTDGGLLHTGTCPDTDCCNTTVDGLPETDIVGGMDGCGRLVRPPGLLDSYRQASRQRLDLVHLEVTGLRDGTPVVPAVFGTPISTWSDAPSSGPWNNDISSWDAATWGRLIVQPSGETYTAYGDTSVIEPNVGFGGFREPTQVGATFAGDVLEQVGGRIVMVIGTTVNAALGLRDEIQARCLQDSVIVLVPNADTAEIFNDAQVQIGVRIDTQGQADQWPPDALEEIGASWVMIRHSIADPTIETYVNAGINVLAHAVSRQVHAERVTGLGVRGIVADDPLYASGQTGRYRTIRDQWAYRTPGHGLLTAATDDDSWRSVNRGYSLLPAAEDDSYGLVIQPGAPADPGWWTVTMGQLCPIPDPAAYTLQVGVRWDTAPDAPDTTMLGLVACAEDDRLILGGDDADFYLCGLRPNGDLTILKFQDGQQTELASTNIGNIGTGTYYMLQLVVASDGLTWTKTSPGQTEFVTTSDTDLRGPFAHLFKSQGDTPYQARFGSVALPDAEQ